MATILSHRERSQQFRAIADQLLNMEALSRDAERMVENLAGAGFPASEIDTAVQQILTPLGTLRTNTMSMLSGLSMVPQTVIKPGMSHAYMYAVITAGTTTGLIEVPSAFKFSVYPFGGLLMDDVVTITNALNPANNGTYTLLHTPNSEGSDQMISEPEFASATPWNITGSDLSIAGGEALFNSSGAWLTQDATDMAVAWEDNHRYEVTVELSTWTAGGFYIGTNGAPFQGLHSPDAPGTFKTVIQVGDSDTALRITGVASADLNVSSITMLPWSGLALAQPLAADTTADNRVVITLSER